MEEHVRRFLIGLLVVAGFGGIACFLIFTHILFPLLLTLLGGVIVYMLGMIALDIYRSVKKDRDRKRDRRKNYSRRLDD